MLAQLNEMWKLPSVHCPLDFSSPFHTNESYFNVDWMFQKIQNEMNQLKEDIELLRNETATFLGTKSQRKVMKKEAVERNVAAERSNFVGSEFTANLPA